MVSTFTTNKNLEKPGHNDFQKSFVDAKRLIRHLSPNPLTRPATLKL